MRHYFRLSALTLVNPNGTVILTDFTGMEGSEPRTPIARLLWSDRDQEDWVMNIKFVVLAATLLAATAALASGPPAHQAGTAQSVSSQTPSFGDDTTGPTNPRGPVQSPDWV